MSASNEFNMWCWFTSFIFKWYTKITALSLYSIFYCSKWSDLCVLNNFWIKSMWWVMALNLKKSHFYIVKDQLLAYARKRRKFIYSPWDINVCSNQRTAVKWYDPYEKNYNVPSFSIFNKNFSFKQNRKKWENISGRKILHIKSAAEKFHAIFPKRIAGK